MVKGILSDGIDDTYTDAYIAMLQDQVRTGKIQSFRVDCSGPSVTVMIQPIFPVEWIRMDVSLDLNK